jgi:hypothetical protein
MKLFNKNARAKQAERPTSSNHSFSGDTIVGTDGGRPGSGEKELRVTVLEAFHEHGPDEPWTPRGTNRRTDDIPEERTDE